MLINVGCGSDYRKGWVNIDNNPKYEVDLCCEADKIPLKDGCASYILASHILEHTKDTVRTMSEWHRLLMDGGVLEVVVPHYNSGQAWSGPTHLHAYTFDTFKFFVKGHHSQERGIQCFPLFSSLKLSGLQSPLFKWLPFKVAVYLSERVPGLFWEINAKLVKGGGSDGVSWLW